MNRIIVVGEVQDRFYRLDTPVRAEQFYLSTMFIKRKRYARHTGHPWCIVTTFPPISLIRPETKLTYYDTGLLPRHIDIDNPATWYMTTASALGDMLPDGPVTLEVHASRPFVCALEGAVELLGASDLVTIEAPLEGLSGGQQLRWYDNDAAAWDDVVRLTREHDGMSQVEMFEGE